MNRILILIIGLLLGIFLEIWGHDTFAADKNKVVNYAQHAYTDGKHVVTFAISLFDDEELTTVESDVSGDIDEGYDISDTDDDYEILDEEYDND